MIDKYINPHTDFGFKRLFGSEFNKELLISFLNAMFHGEQNVQNVTYLNSEQLGDRVDARRAIFDVYCENEHGEKFIVEMQNAFQTYFKDRSLYYSTFPIREQAPKGTDWNFRLKHVYVVALLNFEMNEESFCAKDINHDIGLLDKKTHRIFNDKLTFKYVEIAKFDKEIDQLETVYDKWLYVLKNLSRLDRQPKHLQSEVFNRLFAEAEMAKFTKQELKEYEDSLKAYRDIKNSLDTAKEEGRMEGREEGLAEGERNKALEIAKAMKSKGFSAEDIAQITGLAAKDIENL